MGISTQTTVTCDGCGEAIEQKLGLDNHYILLRDATLGNPSDFSYAVIEHPQVERAYTFHSLKCLLLWADKQRNNTMDAD